MGWRELVVWALGTAAGYSYARYRRAKRLAKIFEDAATGRISEEELFDVARRDPALLHHLVDIGRREPRFMWSLRRAGLVK